MSVSANDPQTTAKTNEYYLTRQSQMESNVRSYPRKLPLAIAKAKGCWVTDVEGNEYLDCLAGAGTLALGHNHPAVIQNEWFVRAVCTRTMPAAPATRSPPITLAAVSGNPNTPRRIEMTKAAMGEPINRAMSV